MSTLGHAGIGWQMLVHAFKPKSGLNIPKLTFLADLPNLNHFMENVTFFRQITPKFKWQEYSGRFATTTARTGVLAPIKPCWAFVGRMLGVCWARVGSVLGCVGHMFSHDGPLLGLC